MVDFDLDIFDFETLQKVSKSIEMIDEQFGGSPTMKRAILKNYGLSLDDCPTVFEPNPVAKQAQEKVVQAQQDNENESLKLQEKLTYGDKWYVLQNRLLNAIVDLDLNERRLIMFLSPMVRKDVEENPNKNRRIFVVKALDFAEKYEIDTKNIYRVLANSASGITDKSFYFWNFKENSKVKPKNKVGSNWVDYCEYKDKDGCIEISLTSHVIEMLTVFDKTNPFTKYQIDVIVKLGCYGIILFELIVGCLHQNFRKKSYTIEYLKEKFNCVNNYKTYYDFKRYVLDRAIKEIHDHTTIRISYEQKKVGRKISELIFSFEDTAQKKLEKTKEKSGNETKDNNPFVNFKMSQKQLAHFAIKIHQLSNQDIDNILDELCNVHLQANHVNSLKKLGFVPSDWYSDDEIKSHPTAEQIAQAEEAERLKKVEQQQLKRQQKQQQAEAEQLAQQQAEQDFIDYFESLPMEVQELALDLTYEEVKITWGKHFKKDRQNGIVHKTPIYRAQLKRNIGQAISQLG